jgi:pyruvate-formate lyase-activating enzyme
MTPYAYLDLCFLEFCNLTCVYCRANNEGMVRNQDFDEIRDLVTAFHQHSEAAVLKVSGYGEIAHWKPLVEFLKWASPHFPSIQVMTNGTMPRSLFDQLTAIPNVSFCLTLDCIWPDGNVLRTAGNTKLHERMVQFAEQVCAADIPLELNCVLSQANIDRFADHVEEVGRRFGDVLVYPFPVRPFEGLAPVAKPPSRASAAQAAAIVLGEFSRYSANLPPRSYTERLFHHLEYGERQGRPCLVPAMNYGVGPSLSPLRCACLGHAKPSDDLSNQVFAGRSPGGGAARVINLRDAHEELARTGWVDERCMPCFTHYEVLDLFARGVISLEEMGQLPVFRYSGAKAVLARTRARVASFVQDPIQET